MIITETCRSGPYLTNGTTTTFAYAFRVDDASDLQVWRTTLADAGETLLTNGVDYTVTGVGVAGGGTIVCPTAIVAGFKLVLQRRPDFLQGVDFENGDAYLPDTVESSLDSATEMSTYLLDLLGDCVRKPRSSSLTPLLWLQSLATSLVGSGVYLSETYLSAYADLDAALAAIGALDRTLVVDTAGALTAATAIGANVRLRPTSQGRIDLAGFHLSLVNPPEAGDVPIFLLSGGSLTLSPGTWNVRHFGATGDGATDDTLPIKAVIEGALANSTVYFPPGKYVLKQSCEVAVSDLTIKGDPGVSEILTQAATPYDSVWTGGHVYGAGAIVAPATWTGYVYTTVAGGTSAGGEPAWPVVVGNSVVDNTVTWVCAAAVPTLTAQVGYFHAHLKNRLSFYGLTLRGDSNNGGISFHGCNDVRVESCSFYETHSKAIANHACVGYYDNIVPSTPVGGGVLAEFSNCAVTNCYAEPTAMFFLSQGRGNCWLKHVRVNSCTVVAGPYSGGLITTGCIKLDYFTLDALVSGCVLDGGGYAYDGINVQERTEGVSLTGNVLLNWARNAINIEGGQTQAPVVDCAVTGNVIRRSMDLTGTAQVQRGITVAGSSGLLPVTAAAPQANQLQINGAYAVLGVVNALAASEYGFGDADAIGFDTIYVRLADGTDPDTKPIGYVRLYDANGCVNLVDRSACQWIQSAGGANEYYLIGTNARGINIQGNVVDNCDGGGIFQYNYVVTDLVIKDNIVTNCGQNDPQAAAGIVTRSDNARIEGNTVTHLLAVRSLVFPGVAPATGVRIVGNRFWADNGLGLMTSRISGVTDSDYIADNDGYVTEETLTVEFDVAAAAGLRALSFTPTIVRPFDVWHCVLSIHMDPTMVNDWRYDTAATFDVATGALPHTVLGRVNVSTNSATGGAEGRAVLHIDARKLA